MGNAIQLLGKRSTLDVQLWLKCPAREHPLSFHRSRQVTHSYSLLGFSAQLPVLIGRAN